eukprot:4954620-Amphidinium_carterae.1
MGLVLLDSLQGDAGLLVQDVPLDRVTQADGVDFLLGLLAGMEQQRIQSYGSSMRAYETVSRKPGELLKSYHARFQMVEAQLERSGLKGYQAEARAHKWLTGANLQAHDARNAISAAGAYDVEKLRVALDLMFPGSPPPDRLRPKGGKDKGGKGKNNQPQQALATEHADAQPHENYDAEGWHDVEQQAAAPEQEPATAPEEVDWHTEVSNLAEVLSVTAQRLKHFTLNRGWKGHVAGAGAKGKGKSSAGSGGKD